VGHLLCGTFTEPEENNLSTSQNVISTGITGLRFRITTFAVYILSSCGLQNLAQLMMSRDSQGTDFGRAKMSQNFGQNYDFQTQK
jgi:hypothetical protein